MKTEVRLWVRLKVIDLVAQTARITLTDKLDFADTLKGLTHYWYWGMDVEAADTAGAVDQIDRVIRLDSAFTNQNKHLYRLAAGNDLVRGDLNLDRDFPGGSDIPARNPVAKPPMDSSAGMSEPGGIFAIDCLVRERRPDKEKGFEARLNARIKGVAVSAMKCGEVWRITVSAPDEQTALALVEKMLVSRSRREGLLLNPHYQTYEILATTRLGAAGAAAAGRAKE